MTLKEFHQALKDQGVPKDFLSFRCPLCKTIQCANDLINVGAGKTFDEVEKYLGFSCVGRWTNAGPAKKNGESNGKGCDWTLGGLFRLHELEVVTPDGEKHPRFEPVTKKEAQEKFAGVSQSI